MGTVPHNDNEEFDKVGRELRERVGGEFRLAAEETGGLRIAEAVSIAAVALVLLAAALAILEVSGVDTIAWLREQLNLST
jgi:hypothetical protein